MSAVAEFSARLRRRFRGDSRFDVASRALYSTDASIFAVQPLGVVFPRDAEDVQWAAECSSAVGVPLLARGSGTSLAGQAVGAAVILDCSRWLTRILSLDFESQRAVVQPGVVLGKLNREVSAWGMEYGPDPASAARATMGGVIANNATGAHAIMHGMSVDHLISARGYWSDGSAARLGRESWHALRLRRGDKGVSGALADWALQLRDDGADVLGDRRPKVWRNSSGFRLDRLLWREPVGPRAAAGALPAPDADDVNLASLMAGSEGSLALLTELEIRLVRKTEVDAVVVLAFRTTAGACDAAPHLVGTGLRALELIPRSLVDMGARHSGFAVPAVLQQRGAEAYLIAECDAGQTARILAHASTRSIAAVLAQPGAMTEGIWRLRKAGLGLLDSRQGKERPVAFVEDAAVPLEELGRYVREVQRICESVGVEVAVYGHASSGCLHVRPVVDLASAKGRADLVALAEHMGEVALSVGGTVSSEHGDGLARGRWIARTYGSKTVGYMRSLKRAVDPRNLLNPGKGLDAPEDLRQLRYHDAGGLVRFQNDRSEIAAQRQFVGADLCNGQAVCREDFGGMCPTFQATREESASTRGRANALRALAQFTGLAKSSEARFTARQALDLCLQCSACSRDCPSGVDMSHLKAEFLEFDMRVRRPAFRDVLFGHMDFLAPVFSFLRPLVRAAWSIPGLGERISGMLHIADDRALPDFRPLARQPVVAKVGGSLRRVLVLEDSLTAYTEPSVTRAGAEVLRRLGFEPVVIPVRGSGVVAFSKGFRGSAERRALRILAAVSKLDPSGDCPIVIYEPSELWHIRRQFRKLLAKTGAAPDQVERLIAAVSFEQLILDAGGERLRVANGPSIIYHPHCHERFSSLTPNELPSFRLLESMAVSVGCTPDSCCGMAGSFGYEREHAVLARKVGEMKILPSVRANADALVVASGAACRLQIRNETGRVVKHPVEAVAEMLGIQDGG